MITESEANILAAEIEQLTETPDPFDDQAPKP
jgi:hypothetical protein